MKRVPPERHYREFPDAERDVVNQGEDGFEAAQVSGIRKPATGPPVTAGECDAHSVRSLS